jgi:hypothetical protein
LQLGGEIPFDGPVRLLHGQRDADVPPDISLRLATALRSEDVQVTLVKGGDHRLSREQDIALLLHTVAQIADLGQVPRHDPCRCRPCVQPADHPARPATGSALARRRPPARLHDRGTQRSGRGHRHRLAMA